MPPGERRPVLGLQLVVRGAEHERQRQPEQADGQHQVAAGRAGEHVHHQHGASTRPSACGMPTQRPPGPLPHRYVVRDGRAEAGVLGVLEQVEDTHSRATPAHRCAARRAAAAIPRRAAPRRIVPPVPRPPQPPSRSRPVVRSEHGPGHRGGDGGRDSPGRGHQAQREDLVPGGDVLQLDRQQDLDRRQRRHPHAEAGEGQAGDPADTERAGSARPAPLTARPAGRSPDRSSHLRC